ncbi:uncharacterized protein F5147DRAFT_758226 [Suillus discolor]|uniref:Uncharacterized protein n=1 Tax=Suillus discolor TaxID=1912936 RepID=A0A9P7FF72_9AGAM|nr:uncharacterized protein F5147DRAFT_758226 [Suillus discolor]KAG2116642.1 hypothetical protein F5147DRAFT_758226 [Suillus discolor]
MQLIKAPDILPTIMNHYTAALPCFGLSELVFLPFVGTLAFHGAESLCFDVLCFLPALPATTMSSACHPDGSLKDASEMEWYNDIDDDSPMLPLAPAPTPAPTHNGNLNSFIRCLGRAIKPMEKIRETANNVPAKRSALGPPPQRAPAPKRAFSRTSSKEDEDAEEEAPLLEDFTDDEDENEHEHDEAYQKTKKLGDQDREDRKSLKKDERSADLTTVFTLEKGRINPHTQESEDGWWCEGFVMHDRAIPQGCKTADMACSQATLDASLPPKVPAFTKSGLMDYIVELIVAEDEAFQLVDKGPFRRLLQYLRPSLSDRDIPHFARSIDPSGDKWNPIERRVQ